MKKRHNALMTLSSLALLVSCGGGPSSSEFSSSRESKQVIAVDQESLDALNSAFFQTLRHNGIALNGTISSEGQFSGTIPAEDSESSPKEISGGFELDYTLSSSVFNLHQGSFKAASSFEGAHDFNLKIGEDLYGHDYGRHWEAYIDGHDFYYNVDEAFGLLMNHLFTLPIETGKKAILNAFPNMPSPLLDDEAVVNYSVAFNALSNSLLSQSGDVLHFYGDGSDYRVDAALDLQTLLKLASKFKDLDIDLKEVMKILSMVSLKDARASLRFNTSLGFTSFFCKFDIGIKGKVEDLIPVDIDLPQEILGETIEVKTIANIELDFTYDKEVVLPQDLDSYTPIETSLSA